MHPPKVSNTRRRLYVGICFLVYLLLFQDMETIVNRVIKHHQILTPHYEVFPSYAKAHKEDKPTDGDDTQDRHSNWAVIVGASRYFYNYRHTANALSMYRIVKQLGIPDERIILMLADDTTCTPRNIFPGQNFNHRNRIRDLYGDDIEVDFRGDEVTVENFVRVLSGRQPPWTPRNKRLSSDASSRVFVYITGHSGDRFLKFRDSEIIGSTDIAGAVRHMHDQKRYYELMFLSDTCQAATLQHDFDVPNVIAIGSSRKDESSYSHHLDREIGVAMIDRFSLQMWNVMKDLSVVSNLTLHDLLQTMDPAQLKSLPEVWLEEFPRNVTEVKLTDFFSFSDEPRILSTKATTSVSRPTPQQQRTHPHLEDIGRLHNAVRFSTKINNNTDKKVWGWKNLAKSIGSFSKATLGLRSFDTA